jgi:hypothetical protein
MQRAGLIKVLEQLRSRQLMAAAQDAGQRRIAHHLVVVHATLAAEIELDIAADDAGMIAP